jgi:hypothetical protein
LSAKRKGVRLFDGASTDAAACSEGDSPLSHEMIFPSVRLTVASRLRRYEVGRSDASLASIDVFGGIILVPRTTSLLSLPGNDIVDVFAGACVRSRLAVNTTAGIGAFASEPTQACRWRTAPCREGIQHPYAPAARLGLLNHRDASCRSGCIERVSLGIGRHLAGYIRPRVAPGCRARSGNWIADLPVPTSSQPCYADGEVGANRARH